ncbi:MAG TPA: hypothetical protein VMT66_08335 [Steroidobacteraceae bacterium]|nr:hypothetical protein [Steroidobacteraceae bacterium]
MPETLAFFASMVATCALLVVLGFSVFLSVLAVRTNGRTGRHGRARLH